MPELTASAKATAVRRSVPRTRKLGPPSPLGRNQSNPMSLSNRTNVTSLTNPTNLSNP
jgi:hypothetical protein